MKHIIDEYGDALLGMVTVGTIVGLAMFVVVTGKTEGTVFYYINGLLGRIF